MAPETPYETVFSRWRERLETEEHEEEWEDAEEEAGATQPSAPAGAVAALGRVPFAVWALIGMFSGFLAGFLFPGLSPVGEGVRTAFGYLGDAAPLIIFFTITPALVTMYQTSSAGKFAVYVMAGFAVSTVLGGLFALLVALLFFPDVTVGIGTKGLGTVIGDLLRTTGDLAFTSQPFKAIWGALFASVLLYFGGNLKGDPPRNVFRRMLRTIADIYQIIGVHGIVALGRIIKIVMPVALFTIGVFIVVTAPVGAVEGYFLSVGVLILTTVLWLILVGFAITQYTKFPVGRLFREYVAVVYPFAWATSSSSVSLPLNMEAARKGLGVRPHIRSFILPLGATVNLDGTMMAAVIATVVAGKMVGYTPSVIDLMIALVPLLLITVGTPGIPGGLAIVSAPVMAAILPLPPGTAELFTGIYIALLFGLNDMFRTAVNTLDNGFLALLMDKWWPERFDPAAEPNPFMEPPEGHIETEGTRMPSPLAVEDTVPEQS